MKQAVHSKKKKKKMRGVKIICSNQFGISVVPETYIMQDKLFGTILCFFKIVLLQVIRRMLQHCSAVKLQNFSADHETSPHLLLTWKWADNDCLLIFMWMALLRKRGKPVFGYSMRRGPTGGKGHQIRMFWRIGCLKKLKVCQKSVR